MVNQPGWKIKPKSYDSKVDKYALNISYFIEDFTNNEMKIYSETLHFKAFKSQPKVCCCHFLLNTKRDQSCKIIYPNLINLVVISFFDNLFHFRS
jgi:hypothetical protein